MKIKRCKQILGNGKQCKAIASKKTGYCFFHDPGKKKERIEAGRKGGKRSRLPKCQNTLPKTTPNVRLKTPQNANRLLAETISQVRRGDLAPQIANSIGYLINIWIRIREASELEDRLKRIEETLEKSDLVESDKILERRT